MGDMVYKNPLFAAEEQRAIFTPRGRLPFLFAATSDDG